MAHHASCKKRIRQDERKRLHNRYYKKSCRTAVKQLRSLSDKGQATELLPKVVSMIDGLAKRNLIHKNKASNLKGKLMKQVAAL